MNEKETLILALINENPFITQNEIAERLQLSRSAAAGYISGLMKKGEIVGRAYVIRAEKTITCIGGANVDRKAVVSGKIQWGTSNPVTTSKSLGGVARNVAENLGRLSAPVALLTVVGDDTEGKWLLEESATYMNVAQATTFANASTGSYTAILDQQGEMALALADMGIYDEIGLAQLDKWWPHIAASSYVLLDMNFPQEVITETITRCRSMEIPLCIAPVSSPKAKKLPQKLEGVALLIANRDEIETITGMSLNEVGQFEKAAERLFARGVESVVITNGKHGVHYFDRDGTSGHLAAPPVHVTDVTGAGDSLTAGVLFGLNRNLPLKEACELGMACSYITLQSAETVSPQLNEEKLLHTHEILWRRNRLTEDDVKATQTSK